MSVWYCECHGLHGPMAQCVKATRATLTTATGLGGRVSEAPARAEKDDGVCRCAAGPCTCAGVNVPALSPESERLAARMDEQADDAEESARESRRYAAWKRSPEGQAQRAAWVGGGPEGDESEARDMEIYAEDSRTTARLLRSPVASLAPTSLAECAWTWSDDGFYDTGCGEAFPLDSGTPTEHGFHFCAFCGGALRAEAARPPKGA